MASRWPTRRHREQRRGSLALLDAIRAAGVPRLIFSSTAACYGKPSELPRRSGVTVPATQSAVAVVAVALWREQVLRAAMADRHA